MKYNYFDDDAEYLDKRRAKKEARLLAKKKAEAALQNAAVFAVAAIKKLSKGKINVKVKSFSLPQIKNARLLIGFRAAVGILLAAAVVFTGVFFYSDLRGSNKAQQKFRQDAGEVCSKLISAYGVCKTMPLEEENQYQLTGLSYVRQMDFDSNGESELLAAYLDGGEYKIEVWGYSGGDFSKLYDGRANTFANVNGCRLTIYSHGGKYYIGEIGEDGKTMQLSTLSFGKFKSSRECEYDAANDIYAIKGEINTENFETVSFSYISANRAESLAERVSKSLAEFDTSEAVRRQSKKSDSELMKDAYYSVVEDLNAKYGKASYESVSDICYGAGLCAVRLIDFNHDGTDELLAVFRYDKKVSADDKNGEHVLKEEPNYRMEVYAWNGSTAVRAFDSDGVSTLQEKDDDSRFYILQKDDEKTYICRNSYSYSAKTSRVWSGTSRISAQGENGIFEPIFTANAESDYGYMSYMINGEKSYRRDFEKNGCIVPYFCGNNTDYDDSEFEIRWLQGDSSKGSDIRNMISETQKTIRSLNSAYQP